MNRRLCAVLFLLGLPGIVAASLSLPSELVAAHGLPAPPWVIRLGSALQGALLLLAAVFAGARFAPRLGLDAPVLASLAAGRPAGGLMRPQLLPALIGGVLGALLIAMSAMFGPAALRAPPFEVSLPVRLLYGGVTEELLLRWGLMTLFAAGCRRLRAPPPVALWFAIGASAVVFGVAHLPALMTASGGLTTNTVLFIVFANAAFGIVAGWLYWRRGLEAAILAHVLAHAMSAAALG